MVHDAIHDVASRSGDYDPKKLWKYPPPENVGLKLDRLDGTRVVAVEAKSPAALAGLEKGDVIRKLGEQRMLSRADFQFVLHHLAEKDEVGRENQALTQPKAEAEEVVSRLKRDLTYLQNEKAELEGRLETAYSEKAGVEKENQTLSQAKAEAEEYKSKLAYMQAEHENYVKSMKKLESQLRLNANRELIFRLLSILDDLERAQIMVPHIEENEPFIEGLQMVVENLKSAFTDAGVTSILCEGQPFDPLRHEAVVREETTEYPPNTVVEELRRGYLLKGELLRPAMVKVAIAPKPAPKEEKVPSVQSEKTAKKK